MPLVNSKERFSDRVDDYVRYRPSYPDALLDLLVVEGGLGPGCVVADIGSGTGILTRRLLERGGPVVGVEPNRAMREAAERALAGHPRFTSIEGSAESTGLEAASVDAITAAQAFHWFDPAATRAEFSRILRPHGIVALVWNQRRDSPLNRDYEAMLEDLAPEYRNVRERDRASVDKVAAFFAPSTPHFATFDNEQRFDEAGLRGRLTSSSYAPKAGDPLHDAILHRLAGVFAAHSRSGFVTLPYDTIVWYGRLT
jgi:SAM-dependent methyltransferase